ncbi:MAG: homocysteine S-methyltransferase family protein [SAR202 cluster bacterium]|jgi:homocysteine S-methyltransferase|nr:homocysteine S-methyltransferase family protein [SAR202 cluster bacterium]MDP6511802.1 homocysteine S-methyltransferase family protein [SAR202 cluster bacterium]MDP6713751.1 homocysteine S-methyltransferase family protein [SAR202 cluster bacterium]
MTSLQERLARGDVVILDGPTSTQLERKGLSNATGAWSALANLDRPDIVRQVHEEYIDAGADVITTNTFATSRVTLETVGRGELVREINQRAVEAALIARDRTANGRDVAIAGSISHFPGWDQDSRGNFLNRAQPSEDRARANFQEQAKILAEAGCDLILLEMMRDVNVAALAIESAVPTGLPVWVGYTCWMDDADLVRIGQHHGYGDGPTFEEALQTILPKGGSLMAVMHTDVEQTSSALKALQRSWNGPLGAYAHSSDMDRPDWQFDDIISPQDYLAHSMEWVDMGVQLIGSCCGTGPDHIRTLKDNLPDRIATGGV